MIAIKLTVDRQSLPMQGRLYRPSLLFWCFPKASNPTTKWNSSISFLSRYKAESEISFWRILVTEGKCIKKVKKKKMSGWSAAEAPYSFPHCSSHPTLTPKQHCFESKALVRCLICWVTPHAQGRGGIWCPALQRQCTQAPIWRELT